MIKIIKKLLMSVSMSVLFAVPVLATPAIVHAATNLTNKVNCGVELNVDPNCDQAPDDAGSTQAVNDIVKLVINLFSIIVGVISVIMIIIGGLKYITSGGDSANVTGAKNTILYAVIGLVVVALAQFIVRFVLAKVSPATGP
ncbi:hypothetical protein HY003_01405 [Candidatus Saccharibacteria bacterium]|nr:hypothetical protein [Candidatus Saccharibacteria bacterium]MBI3337935.1 hypothetical protein [Candidatus Saccharibacteria bacterium]